MDPIQIPVEWDDNGLIMLEEFCEFIGTPPSTIHSWRRPPLLVRLLRSGRAVAQVSEGPTSSTFTMSRVRLSPVFLSFQVSVSIRPWARTRSPLVSESATFSAAVPQTLHGCTVGSPSSIPVPHSWCVG